jgi:hypothetical protein
MKIQKIICIDFDGVLHSYKTGWCGANVIHDPPVQGAISWLISLLDDDTLKPVIYSARSCQAGGIDAMKTWLIKHGLPAKYIDDKMLEFPHQKPAAWLTIDDRAFVFSGVFPSIEKITDFSSWLD